MIVIHKRAKQNKIVEKTLKIIIKIIKNKN
jgi:hypothetical protein